MNHRPRLGEDDEAGLVARAKGGDAAAFSALAGRHQDKLFRFLLKSVKTPADARDLTQEALLQAYRCLASFNGEARFSTWLTGIALNLLRNQINRALKGNFVEYNEENIAHLSNHLDDPAHHHQARVRLNMLARAIEAMPVDMRECLLLIGVEENSYEEVAQLLDVPLGTVKSRMSRARQMLRQDLAGQGFFD